MKLSLSLVSKKVAQLIVDGQKEEAVNLLAGFIFLNKKQKDVDLILDLVMKEHYKITGILPVNLSLAYQKSEAEVESIKKYLSAKLGVKNLSLSVENDPSIVGDFKAKTPIAEVDCSVETKINNLKNQFGQK